MPKFPFHPRQNRTLRQQQGSLSRYDKDAQAGDVPAVVDAAVSGSHIYDYSGDDKEMERLGLATVKAPVWTSIVPITPEPITDDLYTVNGITMKVLKVEAIPLGAPRTIYLYGDRQL